jgi:hypothetical protein
VEVVIHKIALVLPFVRPVELPLPMHQSVFPLATILVSFLKIVYTIAVLFPIFHLSNEECQVIQELNCLTILCEIWLVMHDKLCNILEVTVLEGSL